jgi:hypothetical protein
LRLKGLFVIVASMSRDVLSPGYYVEKGSVKLSTKDSHWILNKTLADYVPDDWVCTGNGIASQSELFCECPLLTD